MSTLRDHKAFTAVFAGDLRKFGGNPFLTETAFGKPFAVGIGNAFDREDEAQAIIEELVQALIDLLPYAQAAIGNPRAAWPSDSVILRAEAAVLKAQGYPPEQPTPASPDEAYERMQARSEQRERSPNK